jgi:hypothetical protein
MPPAAMKMDDPAESLVQDEGHEVDEEMVDERMKGDLEDEEEEGDHDVLTTKNSESRKRRSQMSSNDDNDGIIADNDEQGGGGEEATTSASPRKKRRSSIDLNDDDDIGKENNRRQRGRGSNKQISRRSSTTNSSSFRDAVGDNRNTNAAGKPAEAGIIMKIYVENFMCHRKMTVDLCRNVNFIYGQNGSGKVSSKNSSLQDLHSTFSSP